MINHESGLAVMNVDEVVKLLSRSYSNLINNNIPLKNFPSVMLWGAPGIGKSQGVYEIADIIGKNTCRQVNITDVRLLLFNPVDLRGIPSSNAEKTAAVWLRPKIFQMDESADVINILFLDEISAAPQSVQAAAYQITLDRTIGEHKLPENCIVIAAGNRVTDKSVAYNMPRALANRLLHIEMKGDADSWHDWAVSKGIHSYVTGFLEYNPTAMLRTDSTTNILAFPTPRSWEMVSNILNQISDNIDVVRNLIIGCIGAETAYSFFKWCELYPRIPKVGEIFDGLMPMPDKREEVYIALRSAMVSYAAKYPTAWRIENSIEYALNMPWSFRTALLHDYALIPQLQKILEDNPIYAQALKCGVK